MVLALTADPFGPGFDEPGLFEGLPTGFLVFFGLAAVLVAAGFALVVLIMVRNARRLRQAGMDPLTAQSELLLKLHRSRLLSGESSLQERLGELDRLYQQGQITSEERQQARNAVLGGTQAS